MCQASLDSLIALLPCWHPHLRLGAFTARLGGVWHRPMVDPIALHCVCGCQEPILHACKCKCQAASRALSSATAWEYQVGRTAVFPNVGDGKWGANTIFPQPCKALSHFYLYSLFNPHFAFISTELCSISVFHPRAFVCSLKCNGKVHFFLRNTRALIS